MELTRLIFTKRFMLQLLAWALITVVALGVCAECQSQGGWSQGGSDSEPHWRR
jgi:hypothetical protein